MRLPRDMDYQAIIKSLVPLGYTVTRQTDSHIRITTELNGQHHITIPAHDLLKSGL